MREKSFSKNIGLIKCRKCDKPKHRLRSELDSDNKFIYRDELGRRWNRLWCPICYREYKIQRSRITNKHKSRFEAIDHKNKLGLRSEFLVKKLFESNGYIVSVSTTRGPDLTFTKDKENFITCEVKTVSKQSGDCWSVSPVYPKRRNDDLIAFVLPDDKIHVEPMIEHLSKCSPCGRRSLTNLVRAYRNTQ